MPPLAALLLLLWAAASSASAASFTCAKPSTCRSAVAYVVPNATTYEQLASRFSPTATLHHLLAANQLPPHTDTSQAIPAKTAVRIPFRCRCAGGLGQSDLDMYTGGRGDDYFMEVVTANNVAAGKYYGRRPLPCSCDKVDGSHVMHLAYVIVRAGDNISQIAAKYGLRESTLLRINNITSSQLLIRQGHILDIPLFQGMGTWSRVHYNSAHRKRRLQGGGDPGVTTSKVINIVKVVVPVLSVLVYLVTTWCYWRSARNSLSSGANGFMEFSYSDLACATNRFSRDALLGEGMFGAVYKATFKGQEVAVKRIKAEGKLEEFHRELQTVGNTRHENLVDLKGWCGKVRVIDGKTWWKRVIKVELFLVFEFISNGDLEHHLHNNDQVLSWDKRYKIVKGIGSALHYLHHECNPCILHRDIKPGNILLNEYFNAKLGDFGLSMIASKNRATVVTTAVGSVGYMDPHLMKDGAVEFSRKSDVYSFGIVLLKIARTQKSREEVWQMRGGSEQQVHVDGVVDERLRFFDRTEMERVVVLGLKCSHSAEAQRPSMEDAMKFLEDGQEFPATTQGDGSFGVPCIVNEEAPMMTHGDVSSYYP
ncbi:hypothetical protein CFC21_069356 [Triticum aestivum]|uniref:Protein kinase domain-containing protein n=3 Tax=Triticum TaxID=4564 RepID=A0A9R1AFI3_TRITD|nr:probable L-type lectin-domain containing receptor kinase S.7 [Triticum aestivum]KAF7062795.1 hypothetical protein CFC21_069356 [Triticum aestivum]VAI25987.1 unnamed protein product [Triticum turgidum subsp. durum]